MLKGEFMVKVEALLKEALELANLGDLDGAERKLKEALDIENLPELWNNLGNVYRRKGFLYQAIEAYQKALSLDEDFHIARLNLGVAFLEIKRYSEAIMILQPLLGKLDRDELYLALAIAYEKSGKYADFAAMYDKVKSPDKDKILSEYGVESPAGRGQSG